MGFSSIVFFFFLQKTEDIDTPLHMDYDTFKDSVCWKKMKGNEFFSFTRDTPLLRKQTCLLEEHSLHKLILRVVRKIIIFLTIKKA